MDKEIHASMIGSLCDRAIYYHANNFEQSVQEKSRRILETGSMFEALAINWLRQDYGLLVSFNPLISGAKKGELKLSIPVKGGNIIGKPDCFINGKELHNVLVDIKSMNARSFSRWKRLGSVEDKPSYTDQLHVYALGAINIGIKVESLGIVGVNKDNSDMHIDLFDFDNERMNKIIKRAEFIFSCNEAPEPGERLQDWSCSYCPYSTICEIAQSKKNTDVGNSVSVTEDKDVISAMELLQEAREMERDAKELEALAKETLDKKVRLQGNSFSAWGQITPRHNAFIDAIINSKLHIIATIRSKTEYAQVQNEKGKAEIKKLGLGLVQREGIDYEFTTVFDLSMEHTVTVSKDRTSLFDGQIFTLSQETGQILREWLDSGLDVPQPVNIANEKRRLYENYLRLFEYDPQNSAALAQEAMMNVVNGKSSKDWTEEDLKNLEADLRLRDNSGLEVAV